MRVSSNTIPNQLPARFAAGETVKARLSFLEDGFSAEDGWALKVWLKGPVLPEDSGLAEGVDGVPDGSAWLLVIAAADSADATSGTYTARAALSKAGEVYFPESGKGTIYLEPNIATAEGNEFESYDEVMLTEVRARLKSRVQKDMSKMNAFDRAAERELLKDLRAMETYYLERIAARLRGSAAPPSIRVAFVNP